MNIRRIVTNGLALGVCLTTVSLCGLSLKENQDKSIKSIRQNMEYVKANAPEKYKEFIETKDNKSINYSLREKLWENYANNIRDSLKIDSIAKTNYAKGLQLAKDSLEEVN